MTEETYIKCLVESLHGDIGLYLFANKDKQKEQDPDFIITQKVLPNQFKKVGVAWINKRQKEERLTGQEAQAFLDKHRQGVAPE